MIGTATVGAEHDFSVLQTVEKDLKYWDVASEATYRRFGRWWIRAERSPWTMVGRLRSIAGIHPWPRPRRIVSFLRGETGYRFTGDNDLSGIFGPFVAAPFAQSLTATVYARAFWSFSYIVAFYPGGDGPGGSRPGDIDGEGGFCVKIAPLEQQRDRLQVEMESQRTAFESTLDHPYGVSVPDVRADGNGFRYPYFVQDRFRGTGLTNVSRSRQRDAAERLFGFLTTLYGRQGIQNIPVSEAWTVLTRLDDDVLSAGANTGSDTGAGAPPAAPAPSGLPRDVWDRFVFLRAIAYPLLEDNRCVPCGFVHGDVNKKNILVGGGGEVALIDWGSAGRTPLVRDLDRFLWKFRDPRLAARSLEYLNGESTGYPAETQLFLHYLANGTAALLSFLDPASSRAGTKHHSDTRILLNIRDSLARAQRYAPSR